jgi:HemY protein
MKFLVWLLALFTAAVTLALFAKNPGYVLFVYPPYRIELSLTLFVFGLLVLLALGYVSARLLIGLLQLPSHVRSYREQRALGKSRTAMLDALTAFFEGRYAAAEKAAVRAMESGDRSGILPIIAARSAHELREFEKRDRYLASTAGKSVGEDTMRLIAQSEFMLDQKQPLSALDALNELSSTLHHKHVGALQLELRAQQQARNWDGVLAAVAQLEKRSAIASQAALQAKQQAWLEKLNMPQHDLKALTSLWKSIPDAIKKESKITAVATPCFVRFNDCKSAQQILTDSLNTHWDSDLVTLYGDCKESNLLSVQISQAEKWLPKYPDDAGLLLALGKLCLNQNLWGKAQSYLDASISLQPSKAAYTALAQLAEKLNKPDDANKYYQLAMKYD